ncbi:MAG: DUF1292 domain-containing protein [Methanomicrobia archaeon]|jgi:uncharacterized protein YrzB (UPF0473 family)|nr:DUF1292 domain-containing protein [Methanomicrobia archaeon]
MILKDNQIIVTNEKGEEYRLEILFTYENEQRKTKYVLFFDPQNEEDILVARYDDEGHLEDVDDDEEFDEVEEVLNAYLEDPKIQGEEE